MNFIDDIKDYLPQRHPFIMVDKLVEADELKTVSKFLIKPDNLFCENGRFYEGGLIENMAQTVAAGAGYKLKKESGSRPKIGVIGSVRNLKIEKRPNAGSELITESKLISLFDNAMVVECTVEENGITIAGCQINIFILENQTQ